MCHRWNFLLHDWFLLLHDWYLLLHDRFLLLYDRFLLLYDWFLFPDLLLGKVGSAVAAEPCVVWILKSAISTKCHSQ